jgi:hypothetical protein
MTITLNTPLASVADVFTAEQRARSGAGNDPERTHEAAWQCLRVLSRGDGRYEVVALTDDGAQALEGRIATVDDLRSRVSLTDMC